MIEVQVKAISEAIEALETAKQKVIQVIDVYCDDDEYRQMVQSIDDFIEGYQSELESLNGSKERGL